MVGQLLPNESTQHVHEIAVQFMLIIIPELEHNGMVPVNWLEYKDKDLSFVRLLNVDGMLPVN